MRHTQSTQKAGKSSGFGLMHAGMAICCAVMLLPIGAFFLAGGTIAGLFTNLGLFAPIALCIGVHVAMFAVLGRSCHGSSKGTAKPDQSSSHGEAVNTEKSAFVQ